MKQRFKSEMLDVFAEEVCAEVFKKEEIEEHNSNWPQIADHLCRLLITGGSGTGKTNALLNLINHGLDIDKTFYMLKIHMKQNINY